MRQVEASVIPDTSYNYWVGRAFIRVRSGWDSGSVEEFLTDMHEILSLIPGTIEQKS